MEIVQTKQFKDWFAGIRDTQTQARIAVRLRRFSLGNSGDVQPVHKGVHELRMHFGPGYRMYFIYKSKATAIFLVGGTKGTQHRDIKQAVALAKDLQRRDSNEK